MIEQTEIPNEFVIPLSNAWGYTETIPGEPDKETGFSPAIPNPQTREDFINQCVTRYIMKEIERILVTQATIQAETDKRQELQTAFSVGVTGIVSKIV